ncbi:MAG: ATP-binding protein [Dysgonamonadaceae bacterium]|jgi:ATP-dependent DNA helicase RecG|nr:ATP-binding protein [Dysgonamonadaceae bacterium]
MEEGKLLDKKSLRFLKRKNTDWDELAKGCIAFANSHGGFVLIGVEDDAVLPTKNQTIEDKSVTEIIHKKISERAINVTVAVSVATESNKAEYQSSRDTQRQFTCFNNRIYVCK